MRAEKEVRKVSQVDLVIRGGQMPRGTVRVSGAKNSATRLLAAALVADEPVRLRNFPTELVDVRRKVEFMQVLGAEIELDPVNDFGEIRVVDVKPERVRDRTLSVRTTYLLAAGQLVRTGKAYVPYPGGCKIGERGYDLHVLVWEKLGCQVRETEKHIEVTGQLVGGEVEFPFFTVGGTENALISASVAKGTTIIRNAYISPEVEDLIAFLRHLGASIEVHGNSLVVVHGADGLLRGASFDVMPDRIEALTWIIYGVLSGGEIVIEDVPFEYMEVPFLHLRHAGVDVFRNSRSVYVGPKCVSSAGIQPFEVSCGTYPGVISDMQPFYVLLGLFANGISRVHDYRYPSRTAYARELALMAPGALEIRTGEIVIRGPAAIQGAEVQSTDLRGSMALVLAALLAEGDSIVRNADMALRGYNKLIEKLAGLGVYVEQDSGWSRVASGQTSADAGGT